MKRRWIPTVGLMIIVLLGAQACGTSTSATDSPSTDSATPAGQYAPAETIPPQAMPTAAPAISVEGGTTDGYVAMVNGQQIARSDFEARFAAEQAVFQQQPDHDLTTEAGRLALARFRTGILDRMIDEMLITQAAAAMQIELAENAMQAQAQERAAQTGLELFVARQQVQGELYAQALMETLTADLSRALPQVHVRQILAADVDQANAALAALDAGQDWDTVVAQYSVDPASAETGGDLGYLPAGVMPPAFDQAAFTLESGHYSDVVQSETGLHILMVVDRAEAMPVDDAYWPAVQQSAFDEWLAAYRDASTILLVE